MQRIVLSIIVWSIAIMGYAQQPPAPEKLSVKLTGFRQDKKVFLRWLMDNVAQWRYANANGYLVERAEAGSNNYTALTQQPLKPLTREKLGKYDSASAPFLAGALVLSPSDATGDGALYSMYFLVSSYSTEAAVSSASGFVDSSVVPGKTYTYRVSVAGGGIPQMPGTWAAPATADTLPATPTLKAAFSNRRVTLNWDNQHVATHYYSTVLERSVGDSLHFRPFNLPLMRIKTTAAGEKVEDDFLMSHADTISNGARYYYRIKGLTIFGITGNSSNTVGGIPGPDLDVAPVIESVDEQNGNRLLLKWSLPDSVQPVVAKYEIWRSTKYDTGFTRIAEVKAGIPFQKQLTITALPVNYIIVKAIGTREGQVASSAPYLYQQIDSIAPAAPTGLSGVIDSNGVVTLTWKPNKEADMLGYRVLRATSKTAEFVVLNAKPGGALTFLDTVPVKQLNESIFYKIAAIDNRYNESQQSQIVEVKRPDKIPPTPARLRAVTYKEGRMHVSWIPSFSKDVVSYSLFRLASDDTSHAWKQVATFKNTDTTYTDRNIAENTKYSYSIQAMDDANLLSKRSAVLSENVPKDRALKKGVRNFNTYVSREYKYIELNWQDNDAATNEYWLYRASGNGKLTLIVTLPGKTRKYVDEDLRASTSYRYAIKVVYKDGTGSKMEKTAVTY